MEKPSDQEARLWAGSLSWTLRVTRGDGKASPCPPHVLPLLATLPCLLGHMGCYGGRRAEESC